MVAWGRWAGNFEATQRQRPSRKGCTGLLRSANTTPARKFPMSKLTLRAWVAGKIRLKQITSGWHPQRDVGVQNEAVLPIIFTNNMYVIPQFETRLIIYCLWIHIYFHSFLFFIGLIHIFSRTMLSVVIVTIYSSDQSAAIHVWKSQFPPKT